MSISVAVYIPRQARIYFANIAWRQKPHSRYKKE